ncbi:unnamed protein product, partial [Mesorhabditis spiculigera]
MAADFNPVAFLDELESFGRPPPPRQLGKPAESSPSTSEIVTKLNALNLEKQKKMRTGPVPPSENGMLSLGKKMNAATKEEISREEASGLRQMVVTASPNYKPGHGAEPERYGGVDEEQKMVGKTFSYGVISPKTPTQQKATNFPKVDVLNSPPTRYTSSSPSTSEYSERGSTGNRLPKNGISYPEYGREKQIGPAEPSPKPHLSSEDRLNRWKEMDAALAKQDEKFGRLSAQIREDVNRMRVDAQKIGNCFGCKDAMYYGDEATVAMDRKYHPGCFKCQQCERNLKDLKFYFIDDKFLCQEDFLLAELHKKADKCAVCHKPIVEMVLQAVGKSFHPGCFNCSVCGKCLDGVQFAVDEQDKIFCTDDYYERYAPRCHSCRKPIMPKKGTGETVRVVALGNDYHLECYSCEGCGKQLGDDHNEQCHPLNGHLLCRPCHQLWKATGGAPTTDL